jgi:hypothetical protein
MAMAAMIRMIATTISSSISEKPFCLRIVSSLLLRFRNIDADAVTILGQVSCQSLWSIEPDVVLPEMC